MKRCCQETIAKVAGDEPVFVLRGKDLLAPHLVGAWIAAAQIAGVPQDKIDRARDHYRDMLQFQMQHPERCKIPD